MSEPSSPKPASYSPDALSMRDTIVSSDLPRFNAFLSKSRGDDVYEGYDLDVDGMVEMTVYDADTHKVIDREVFANNGLAQKYIDQEEEMMEKNKASGWWAAPEDGDDGWEDVEGGDDEKEVMDDTHQESDRAVDTVLQPPIYDTESLSK
ncbi:hypothetical protein E4T44_00085 [Aureobasidium sp. EXF-8845]|nr:hypothetical protein E4T44_00085 [Aureobasidium sp. EXF-8845]KAI4858269.1 hypothetical protein E4T45_00213 [Aureobasidium sp. EXF-8846]